MNRLTTMIVAAVSLACASAFAGDRTVTSTDVTNARRECQQAQVDTVQSAAGMVPAREKVEGNRLGVDRGQQATTDDYAAEARRACDVADQVQRAYNEGK